MSDSDLHNVLQSAYALIRSNEVNKAFSSITLDHLIQEQITTLKKGETTPMLDSRGESVGNRVSYWDSLDALETDLENVVKAIEDAGDDQQKLADLGITDTPNDSEDDSS